MELDVIYQYLNANGLTDEQISKVLSDEAHKSAVVSMIASYEKELGEKGFSRREALQNYIVYRKNVELREKRLKEIKNLQ